MLIFLKVHKTINSLNLNMLSLLFDIFSTLNITGSFKCKCA